MVFLNQLCSPIRTTKHSFRQSKFRNSMKRLFLILALLSFSSLSIWAQNENRIIKMDKPGENDDEIYLEITSFKVDGNEIFLNEPFTADENWLKNLKVKVKNISGKPMTCVSIGLGLLEGISEELEPQMSWGYALSLFQGDCTSLDKERNDKNFILKKGEETELTYSNSNKIYYDVLEKFGIGKFHKAELIIGTVKFKKGGFADTYLRVPDNVRFFEADDKN